MNILTRIAELEELARKAEATIEVVGEGGDKDIFYDRVPIFAFHEAANPTTILELCSALRKAVGTLKSLLDEIGVPRNLGKSWSEYQIDDREIADARTCLKEIEK